jgi:hypothetical protein
MKHKESDPSKQRFDLTEESSRRTGEEATSVARKLESDDINEETRLGPADEPRDGEVENRVSTSLDEE